MHLRTYSTLLLQDRNRVVSVVSDESEDQESCLLADVDMSVKAINSNDDFPFYSYVQLRPGKSYA